MNKVTDKDKECVSCGKKASINRAQYWYNNQWPLSGGLLIGFHCEKCAKKGRKIYYSLGNYFDHDNWNYNLLYSLIN
jgi:hypothetical protein